jgi:hypothetical protein
MSRLLLIIGIILLLATEILRVYFIMPFPGSQQSDTIGWAYFIEKYKWLLRLIGILLVIGPALKIYKSRKPWPIILLTLPILFYFFVFGVFNFKFQADKIFYQPEHKNFAGINSNTIDTNKLIIGIDINGQARAYPIQIIGYHHQIKDTVGGVPVMVTYCTVCRTGRVYSPLVDGKAENFRLVGMDHFNAMFEDKTTDSWWQQATGIAVAGPLKGKSLSEIPSRQYSLAAWMKLHPNSTILQPDSLFQSDYDDLAKFDKGNVKSRLEKRDSASWKMKSWVIGVKAGGQDKAYDWNDLVKERLIQDSIGSMAVALILENDTASFHVFNRTVQGSRLFFRADPAVPFLTDTNTRSQWTPEGICISGPLKDSKLEPLQAYQEFWHSWKQFHPLTSN